MKSRIIFFVGIMLAAQFGLSQSETSEEDCGFTVPAQLSKSNNEQLTVTIDCPISKFNFKILNRWGQIMYETEVYSFPLDFDIHARMKGKRKKLGPEKFIGGSQYIWILEYRLADQFIDQTAQGNLIILN